MDMHLKQDLARVLHEGSKLAELPNDENWQKLNKVIQLEEFIIVAKEMLTHAVDSLEAEPSEVSYIKSAINCLDDDCEIKDIRKALEEELEEPDVHDPSPSLAQMGIVTGVAQ